MKLENIHVQLDIPATPRSVSTARLFIAATARHFGYAEDVIEDVKLAISEAVTDAIRKAADARVAVTVGADESVVRFDVAARAKSSVSSPPIAETDHDSSAVTLTVIEALFPGAKIELGPAGPSIRFFTERPPFKDPEERA
ncbi:MAG: hypothetical protein NVSMB57_01260 [Actinomycetota bacterium]